MAEVIWQKLTIDPFLSRVPLMFSKAFDHCIENLRQDIMCRGDVAIVTYDWAEGIEDPFPNFNVLRRCRNFEKLLNWVDEHVRNIASSSLHPTWSVWKILLICFPLLNGILDIAPDGSFDMDQVTPDVPAGHLSLCWALSPIMSWAISPDAPL